MANQLLSDYGSHYPIGLIRFAATKPTAWIQMVPFCLMVTNVGLILDHRPKRWNQH